MPYLGIEARPLTHDVGNLILFSKFRTHVISCPAGQSDATRGMDLDRCPTGTGIQGKPAFVE